MLELVIGWIAFVCLAVGVIGFLLESRVKRFSKKVSVFMMIAGGLAYVVWTFVLMILAMIP